MTTTGAPTKPTFSVIIPLEFHRGQALDCVRAWMRQTGIARADYEIILATPVGFPEDQLAAVRPLLGDGDRILLLRAEHDVPLCDGAARAAAGSVFFFTESHCVPEPDVLQVAARAFAEHPGWGGFSLRSERVVHNRLSVIEADMYEADIATHMAPGHWCKILDQCFVVRRDAYLAAGGFDGALGHFAEWMMAARCHRMGIELGYVPEGRIHHYYIGELDEWRSFTEDFVRGEIAALARGDADGFGDLFGFVPEWAARESWSAATARRMLWLSRDDPAGLLRWLPAALGAHQLRRLRAGVKQRLAWWRTRLHERAGSSETLRASLRAYLGTLFHAERVRSIDRVWAAPPPARAPSGAWEAGRTASLRTAGLYPPETRGGQALVWSEPAAMVQLPVRPGRYAVTIQWLPELAAGPAPRFFVDEQPLREVELAPGEARARLDVRRDGARLAWVCRPARRDGRRLGLPLRRIAWEPVSGPSSTEASREGRDGGAASRAAT